MNAPFTTNTQEYRERAAKEAGLPLEYADRLRGESYGEFLEDARGMARDYNPKPQYHPGWCPPLGNPDPAPSSDSPEDMKMKMFQQRINETLDEPGGIWKPLVFED